MHDDTARQRMILLLAENGCAVPEDADTAALLRITLEAEPVPEAIAKTLAALFDAAVPALQGDAP